MHTEVTPPLRRVEEARALTGSRTGAPKQLPVKTE